MAQTYNEICAQFPAGELPKDYWDPIKSSTPLLLLSGKGDPVTPPQWADRIMQGFSNATHITAPGGHHIISAEGCTSQLIADFINKADTKNLNARCVQNIQPLPIYLTPLANDASRSTTAPSGDLP